MNVEPSRKFHELSCCEQIFVVTAVGAVFGAVGAFAGAVLAFDAGISVLACSILFGTELGVFGMGVAAVHEWTQGMTVCEAGAMYVGLACISLAVSLGVAMLFGFLTAELAITASILTLLMVVMGIIENTCCKDEKPVRI